MSWWKWSPARLVRGLVVGALITCAAGLAVAPGASAKPKSATGYAFYTISGSTAGELLRQMAARGPSVEGLDAYAITQSTLSHTGNLVASGGRCRLQGYRISLDFEITIPRASGLASMSPKVRAAWNTFAAFVKRHEETHRSIWMTCARSLEARIKSMTAGSCDVLDSKVNSALNSAVSACRRKHAAFDRSQRAPLKAQPLVRLAIQGH